MPQSAYPDSRYDGLLRLVLCKESEKHVLPWPRSLWPHSRSYIWYLHATISLSREPLRRAPAIGFVQEGVRETRASLPTSNLVKTTAAAAAAYGSSSFSGKTTWYSRADGESAPPRNRHWTLARRKSNRIRILCDSVICACAHSRLLVSDSLVSFEHPIAQVHSVRKRLYSSSRNSRCCCRQSGFSGDQICRCSAARCLWFLS